jgi:hypothetical protein
VKDPKNVDSLRKAIAVMRSRDGADPIKDAKTYRTSWTYWANIHGYFGKNSPSGSGGILDYYMRLVQMLPQDASWRVTGSLYYVNGILDATPPDDVATKIWATCQHGTPWFFAWHRLYLYYFEKQLQSASGNPNLRLPYWDYTSEDQIKMPDEFTQLTYSGLGNSYYLGKNLLPTDLISTWPNPLYDWRRALGWQLRSVSLDPNSTNVDSTFTDKDFASFQNDVEFSVHSYIHTSVAATPLAPAMAVVAYSANDPIFWIHHANIDRLWSCWSNIPGNTNTIADQQFTFVDTDGNPVTNSVSDLFNGKIADLPKYDHETNCARDPALQALWSPSQSAAKVAPMLRMASMPSMGSMLAMSTQSATSDSPGAPQALNNPTPTVNLTEPQTEQDVDFTPDGSKILSQALTSQPATTNLMRVYLRLNDITFKADPGVIFNVYLALKSAPSSKVQVGTLQFFGASMMNMQGSPKMNRRFDVTSALRSLGSDAANGVTVSFQTTTGRIGDNNVPPITKGSDLAINNLIIEVWRP